MTLRGLTLVFGLCAGLASAAAAGSRTEVGATACAGCHEKTVEAYKRSPHGRGMAAAKGVPFEKSCETCHGPGSEHAGGEVSAIVNPAKAKDGAAACATCHAGEKGRMFWAGSAHEKNGCASCHSVHGGEKKLLAKRSELETCSACHADVKSSLMKRSAHPLRDGSRKGAEGKMACSDCHNPHGSAAEKLMAAKSVNDTCYSCHAEKRTPMLWEHGPVKEDCLICHTPHGSSNDKLLTTRAPRLCQSCHMQGRHQSGTGSRQGSRRRAKSRRPSVIFLQRATSSRIPSRYSAKSAKAGRLPSVGSAARLRSDLAHTPMVLSGLLISWATPLASSPTAASLPARMSCSCVRASSAVILWKAASSRPISSAPVSRSDGAKSPRPMRSVRRMRRSMRAVNRPVSQWAAAKPEARRRTAAAPRGDEAHPAGGRAGMGGGQPAREAPRERMRDDLPVRVADVGVGDVGVRGNGPAQESVQGELVAGQDEPLGGDGGQVADGRAGVGQLVPEELGEPVVDVADGDDAQEEDHRGGAGHELGAHGLHEPAPRRMRARMRRTGS